jgi:hypothetical protein
MMVRPSSFLFFHDAHDLIAALQIQAAGGLVGDYDLGIIGQRPGYRYSLASCNL